ncbi:MAG: hypothetical protein HC842_06795 [Cytophagales bacterium]|nr:hypothetical protein [Cytophagales bacterium]
MAKTRVFSKTKTPNATLARSDDEFINVQHHADFVSYTLTFYPDSYAEISRFLEAHPEFGNLSEFMIKAAEAFINDHTRMTDSLKTKLLSKPKTS